MGLAAVTTIGAATISRAPARIYIKVAMAAVIAWFIIFQAAVFTVLTTMVNPLIITTFTHTSTIVLTLISVVALLP